MLRGKILLDAFVYLCAWTQPTTLSSVAFMFKGPQNYGICACWTCDGLRINLKWYSSVDMAICPFKWWEYLASFGYVMIWWNIITYKVTYKNQNNCWKRGYNISCLPWYGEYEKIFIIAYSDWWK